MPINTKSSEKSFAEILVHCGYEETKVPVLPEQNILRSLQAKRIDISSSCGGNGTCGTCKIKVIKGLEHITDRSEIERDFAEDRSFAENERLACQSYCDDSIAISIPQKMD